MIVLILAIQVRGVTFPTSKAVISASRDGTVRLWKLLSDNPPLYDATISSHATAFVNCVTYLPPTALFSEGLIVSGGKDTVIEVREPSKKPEDNAEALLLGHSHNVCSLDVDPSGKFIVSGSWDAEARIWPVGKWECEAVLKGHEGKYLRAILSETQIHAPG
jgi:phospholipase A-2-activating protein